MNTNEFTTSTESIVNPDRKETQATGRQEIESVAQTRLERYYNVIVAFFLTVSTLLIIFILYFSFSHSTITIVPQHTTTAISLPTTVQQLDGVILSTQLDVSVKADKLIGQREQPGQASGTVTIYNDGSSAQPLVATTRLLSRADNEADRVLFRTQESVVVPAGGSVDVPVLADESGAVGDIDPSEFEVVALSSSLKSIVYGKSNSPMTGGVTMVGEVTQADIDQLTQQWKTEAATQAQAAFTKELQLRSTDNQQQLELIGQPITTSDAPTASAAVGQETDDLKMSGSVTVVAVAVNQTTAINTIQQSIVTQLTPGLTVDGTLDFQDMTFSVSDIDKDSSQATVEISVELPITLDETSPAIDARNFTNKSAQEIQTILGSYPVIESVDVSISPWWNRTTPRNSGNIKVTVEKK